MYSSPLTPTGTQFIRSSNTYICMFSIGCPIGTPPSLDSDSSAAASYTQQPTTVSVGPYSFINRVAPLTARQCLTSSQLNASPPITKHSVPTFSPPQF